MPSPNDIPRRPLWRYAPVHIAGLSIIPANTSDEDRKLVESRLIRNENNDQHDDIE